MGPSLSIHSSARSSGIKIICICHEGIKLEPMDIEEATVKPKVAVEPVAVPKATEEEEEYEETITISASDLVALQETLEDIRF
jgi:hypothetical protein